MIEFFCRCGFQFSVPPETAGREIQCPKCGLLNDVPRMSELEQFGPDGTYKVTASPVQPDPHGLQDLVLAYGRHKYDEEGRPLDLRYPVQSVRPVEEIPVADTPEPARPRYDPETGELVKPIELAPGPEIPNPAAIPMARPMIQYASGENARQPINPLSPARMLLHPVNLTVMFFVLLVHVLALVILTIPMPELGVLFLPAALLAIGLIIAHLANVIEEVGPQEKDELPRFMRDLSVVEDIILPFLEVVLSLVLCYLPALIALDIVPGGLGKRIALALAAVGTFLFPATLLTSTTSGALSNLRPDRPWRMIGILGPRYFLIVGLFVGGMIIYATGLVGALGLAVKGLPVWLFKPPTNYLLLIAGIFLSHYFCWTLGLIWRGWHRDFPWVLQFHDRAPPPVLPTGPPRKATAGSGADRSYTDYRRG
jgi:hypothetical protein